jgi:hypothetical protein
MNLATVSETVDLVGNIIAAISFIFIVLCLLAAAWDASEKRRKESDELKKWRFDLEKRISSLENELPPQ